MGRCEKSSTVQGVAAVRLVGSTGESEFLRMSWTCQLCVCGSIVAGSMLEKKKQQEN